MQAKHLPKRTGLSNSVREIAIGTLIGALLFALALAAGQIEPREHAYMIAMSRAERVPAMVAVAAALAMMCGFNYALLSRLRRKLVPGRSRRPLTLR